MSAATAWSTMTRPERVAAVRDGAAAGLTAEKLARLHQTGFWAIAGVAKANGIALPDVPAEPSSNPGGDHVDTRDNTCEEKAGAGAREGALAAPVSVVLEPDVMALLEAMSERTGRGREDLAASLIASILIDDALAHAELAGGAAA